MKRFAISALFALGLTLFANSSFAQQDSFLNVHTKEQVAIPGHVLAPGDYVFRLLDSDEYPHIVEVMSADGSSFYALFQVVPAKRSEFGDNSRITLTAPDAAGLKDISQWYFPGESTGYQFVYSRKDIQKQDRIAYNLTNPAASGLQ